MVTTDVNTVTYNGNGSRTAFPFTFKIQSASEINLQLVYADGTVTDITSDYYVDTVNSTVHYPGYAPGSEPAEADRPAPVQTGQKLTIWRDVPMTQEADLGDKWPFEEIENGLDKLTMICQQIYAYTNRKLDAALASMFQLAGIVTDSDKLQHITDQFNAIDANAAAAAESEDNAAASEANALSYKNAAAAFATNASNSASSASTTARVLTDIYNEAIASGKIVAPAVDPTLTISGAAADAKVTGDTISNLNADINGGNYKVELELGTINFGTGQYVSNPHILRTKEGTSVHLVPGDIIGLTDYTTASFYVGYLDSVTGLPTHVLAGWKTADYTVETEHDYVVLIQPQSAGNILKIIKQGSVVLLGEEVEDLRTFTYNDIVWGCGTYRKDTGKFAWDTKNMVTRDILHIKAGSKISKTATDSAITLIYYDVNNGETWRGATQVLPQFFVGEYVVPADCYARVLLQYVGTGQANLNYLSTYYKFELIKPSFVEPAVKIGIFGYKNYLGNAILLQFNDSSNMMIDSFSVGAWSSVNSDLHGRGVKHLDRFMLTHWHSDHCGNIENLINNGYIDNNTIVYLPQDLDTTATGSLPSDWSTVVDAMQTIKPLLVATGCTIVYPTEGQIVPIADCYVKFFNCDHSVFYSNGTYPSQNYNDWSLCAYLFVGSKNMCFVADLGPIGQQKMADLGTMVKANLYTATHHGWDNGNAQNYFGLIPAWINRLQPDVVFSEDYSSHANYIDTPASPMQTWCEKNHVPNYRTYINGSMGVMLTSTGWELLGAYSNYIRGGINWFFDFRDYITETKIKALSTRLLMPSYSTQDTSNLLRNAIRNMLGNEYDNASYKFAFKVRVIDSGNASAYLEYTVTNFIPGSSAGTYNAGTRTKDLYWSAYNAQGTIALTGLTGTPTLVVELIEYSAV